MNDQRPRTSGRFNSARLLWVLGLAAGILIGAAAAFGLAGARPAPTTEIIN